MSKVKKFFFEPLKFWNDYFTKRFNYKAERGYLKTNKKNLIYFCFNDSGNFLLSELLLLTLNNFEKNYEILIICSSKHIDDQNIEKYCVDNNLDFFLVNEDDPYFLRYRIFDWEKINNFEKIFYIDCDVIFNESPKYLFEKCIKAFNIAYHDYGKIFLLKEIKKPSPGWFGADVALKENFKFPDNWKIYGSGQFVFKNNETIKKLFSDILYYKNIIGKIKYKYNFKGKYFPFGDQPLLNYFLAKNEIDFDDNILTKHASFNVTKNKSLFIHYLGRNQNKIFKILNIVKKQNFSKEKFNDFSNEDLFLISILADKKNIFINDLQNKNTNFENLLKISNFLPNLNIFTTTERAKIYNFYVRNKIKVYICNLNDEFLENFDVAFIDSLDFSGFFNVIKNTKLIILNIEKKNNLDHLYREMLANELFEEINLKYENFDTKNLNNKYYQKNKNSNLSESLIKMFKSRNLIHRKWLGDSPERIELISKLSSDSEHITEFGVYSGCSTLAFILAKPKKLISYDITDQFFSIKRKIEQLAKENKINYQFLLGDSCSLEIEETDLLFIDTIHTYKQTKNELNKHHLKVKKHILLHDYNSHYGVKKAVDEFLLLNNNFKISYLDLFNDGLIRLTRT